MRTFSFKLIIEFKIWKLYFILTLNVIKAPPKYLLTPKMYETLYNKVFSSQKQHQMHENESSHFLILYQKTVVHAVLYCIVQSTK